MKPATAKRAGRDEDAQDGLVTAAYGRRYRVELAGGAEIDCVTRGRKSDIACGDRVRVATTAPGSGVIESIAPRTSLFYRSDAFREKLIAANVTQVVIVVAPVPSTSLDLLDVCLAAAEHAGIATLIVANKRDLPGHAAARAALAPYGDLGYRVLDLCAKTDITPLASRLANEVSVLVGQSGMGKSTIVNRLVPHAAARVAAISEALDSGRHTTTHAELFHLPHGGDIIDSPGMQVFGVHHVEPRELAAAYVELRPYLGACRFRDCMHLEEPGCAVVAASAEGKIAARRLASYRTLARERLRQARLNRY